jgi:hypothetical protein
MAVTKISCPGCGANLSPTAGLRGHKCEYCGTAVSIDQPPPAKVKEPKRVRVPQTSATLDAATTSAKAAVSASKSVGRVLLSVFFSIVVLGGGILYAVFTILSKSGVDVSDALKAANVNIPVFSKERSELPGLGGLGGFTLWDSVGGRPLALEVEGKPAFIGRIRQKPDDSLNFVAVDGTTGEILYTVGPFADYSDGYRNTYVAVAGDRLAVSDHEAKLHLVDAGSGATVKTLELKDRVKSLCGAADGSTFWIEQVDKRRFLVDPQTGTLGEGKRPDGCVGATDDDDLDRKERRELRRFDRKLDDFKATDMVEDGEWTIVAGYKNPGTAVPKAAGINADGEVAWTIDVPTIDPLRARERSNQHNAAAQGRYFTIYGEGQKTWHVAAIDATSGDRIWDQRLRTIFAVDKIDGLYATEDFVLVVRTSSLEIHDPATGKLRGTIGREAYED